MTQTPFLAAAAFCSAVCFFCLPGRLWHGPALDEKCGSVYEEVRVRACGAQGALEPRLSRQSRQDPGVLFYVF